MCDQWIGVDFDGTLAKHGKPDEDGNFNIDEYGPPIPLMVERVKEWLSQGIKVKIVTARLAPPFFGGTRRQAIKGIHKFCAENGLPNLPVQCHKDADMIQLWDDRAVEVENGTGRRRVRQWEPFEDGDA